MTAATGAAERAGSVKGAGFAERVGSVEGAGAAGRVAEIPAEIPANIPAEIPAKTHAPTPGQTVGPFFAYGTDFAHKHEIAFPHSPGAIVLSGTIRDGEGNPIPDSMIEIFGADSDGAVPRARGSYRRDGHSFTGFGRAFTSDEGRYEFWTRNPGSVTGEAPFFAVVVFARGLPDKLHTRIYLPEAEAALAADPLLSSLTAEERGTLVATRTPEGYLTHDIRVQGGKETVFLAF